MQITLTEEDINQAIRDYVVSMGIDRPIDTIDYTQTRKGGSSITAEIELRPLSSTPRIGPTIKEVEKVLSTAEDTGEEEAESESEEEIQEVEEEAAVEEVKAKATSIFK